MTTKYKDAFECYEVIGRWLTEEAPAPWKTIVVDFKLIAIDDVSEYVIKYYPVKAPTVGKQIFIDESELWDAFYQLARLTRSPEKGLFKKCKFTLFDTGKYTSDFEY